MSRIEKPLCIACGAQGQTLYTDLPDSTFFTTGTWSLSRCPNPGCELVWLTPLPSDSEIIGFYQNYYTHSETDPASAAALNLSAAHGRAGLKSGAKALLGRLSTNSYRFRSDLRYLQDRKPGRLLDVGCGNGAFLAQAAARGWRVFGQEFDAKAASVAADLSGADVQVGSLMDIGFDADFFDAVTLSNVLEHLPNPIQVMREIKRILRPGGLLVSISPNPKSYLHEKYGKYWRGLEVPRHLFLFPPNALRSTAEDIGFTAVSAFSSLGEFDFMEQASQAIQSQHVSDASMPRATPRHRKLALQAAAILGQDVGEWSVIVAER